MIMRLLANLAQRAIVFCVLCLIVWHVTHIGSASHGKAIVFLPQQDLVLTIDNQEYPYKSFEKLLICDLEAGKHVLRLHRERLMIYEEEFTVEPEQEITLVARGRPKRARRRTSSNPDYATAHAAGLATRTMELQPTKNRPRTSQVQ